MKHPYIHTQAVASSTWTITHNLGRYPSSDVIVEVNGTPQKIMPQSVVYSSANQVVISFSTAYAGTARLF